MMGEVHAVTAAVSVVIGVPAILLEDVIILAVSVASPYRGCNTNGMWTCGWQ